MKKFFLLLLTSFYFIAVSAQQPTYSWAAVHSKAAKNAEIQLLGQSGFGYYIVSKQPPEEGQQSILRSAFNPIITVEYFNSRQEKAYTKDMTAGREDDYIAAVYFNNKLLIITALFNKEVGKNSLWAKALNADGTIDKPVEIGAIAAEKLSKRGRFNVESSPDGSKLLVVAQSEYEKDQNEKISISLFTAGFTKVWSSEQIFPYLWSKSTDNRPYVNNAGTAFILKKMDVKGGNDLWSVFSFDGKVLKEYKMAFEGNRNLASVVTAFSPEGDFAAGGYYTERAKVSIRGGLILDGNFLYRINATGQQLKVGAFNPFEKRKEVVAKYILFNNAATVLTGEVYTITDKLAVKEPGTPSSAQSLFARDYFYTASDIAIDVIDQNGSMVYYTRIEKNNASRNDNGYWVSYFATMVKGKLWIIFNDDKYKYESKAISINSPKVIAYTVFDPVTGVAGNKTRVAVFGPVGDKDGDMFLRSDVFIKMDETHYLVRAENGIDYRMGTVSF
jgi:hypothetical protein